MSDQNKTVYDKIAKSFDKTRQFVWDDLKPLAKYAKNGDRVLDAGCGTGRLYHLFLDLQQIEYVGVDQSKEQIKIAKKKFPRLKFVAAEMTKLPFKNNSFDVVFCVAAFHHLPKEKNRLEALKEMKRVLKKDGVVVMTNWNLHSDWAKKKFLNPKSGWKDVGDGNIIIPWKDKDEKVLGNRFYHAFTLNELRGLFEKTGFKIKKQYPSKEGNIISVVQSLSENSRICHVVLDTYGIQKI